MDEELLAIIQPARASIFGKSREKPSIIVGEGDDEIEVDFGGKRLRHTLKPLKELYGKDRNADIKSDQFVPLFATIEEDVARYTQDDVPALTDGAVLLIIKQLAMDPDHEPADPLSKRIHRSVRLCLSVNEYSRQDVKNVFRHISKSIQLHNRVGGTRGYITFIQDFFKL